MVRPPPPSTWQLAKRWVVEPIQAAASARLVAELGCSAVLADLLVRRGVDTPEAAGSFLDPKLADLSDPALLPGIEAAVARIARAVGAKEPITVFGDYDVDGVSSTALLLEFFRFLGHPARPYIPSRLEEGYGLNAEAIRAIAASGTRLLVTVDNGSTAVEEVSLARSLGVDVVITDHHLPSDPLPDACAIVNPWLPGSRYPFPHLAGVGVAFKLVWEIARHFSRSRKVSEELKRFLMDALGYVGLGTIADVVPLVGENRILARFGLMALENTRFPGLAALVRLALDGGRRARLVASDIAFRVAPCLNSAGRLGEAGRALELLTTRDAGDAERLVEGLSRENERRRRLEKDIHREAREQVLASVDPSVDRALVLTGEAWHPGVIGIVASRIVDEFHRPTLLIALEGGVGKGSARSIPQVQIRDALERASGCLVSFGGHAQAAGLRIDATRVEELRRLLNEAIDVAPADMVPEIATDGEVALSMWTRDVIQEIQRLEPFGKGNREPLFFCRDVDVVGAPRQMGRDASHLGFFVRQGDAVLRAVAFGKGRLHAALSARGARVSLVYQPVLNHFRDEVTVEIQAREIETG